MTGPLDVLEESLDVRFYHEMASAKLQFIGQVFNRVVRADTRAKSPSRISSATWLPYRLSGFTDFR
jgi:hypothetical protein